MPDVPALPVLSRRVRTVTGLDPDAIAIEFEGRSYPWRILGDAIEDLDRVLADAGASGVRRIGIVLRNAPPHVAALIATIGTGRTIVTLSPFHGDAGLADDVRALHPSVIVASSADWGRPALAEAAAEEGAVRLVVGEDASIALAEGDQPSAPPGDEADDGIAVLMLTSGTTGRPKRVPLAYAALTAAYDAAGHGAEMSAEASLKPGAAILWTSLVHIGGLYYAIANVVEGRRVALLERFDVARWAALVAEHRPRLVSLNPTAMRMVLDSDVPDDLLSHALAVMSGTAPLPPEQAAEFEARFGVPVLMTYGATEFAGAVAGWSLRDRRTWGDRKPGAVGRAFPGIELRVLDRDTGEPLPTGQVGLLQVRGRQLPAGAEQWTPTTDLASLDDDGFLSIHGRADDAINRGGFKIVPSIITDALEAHPAVARAVAVGVPDRRLGAVPVAAVELRPGADVPQPDELRRWCTERLTKYQVPVAVKIVDELPRTPSMKVSQPMVRALFEADGIGASSAT